VGLKLSEVRLAAGQVEILANKIIIEKSEPLPAREEQRFALQIRISS